MPKKFYTSLPAGYPVCEHRTCPKASSCLHQTAYSAMLKKDDYLTLLNPSRCSRDASCRFYRDNEPVSYARGFTGMQKRMLPGQYKTFMFILIGEFGRNAYFERRRGETALSPQEQSVVLEALRQAGISEELKFDKYEECFNWYD